MKKMFGWVDKFKSEDFRISRKGKWYAIAPAIIILVGIIVVSVINFNLGMDFTGGQLLRVNGVADQAAYTTHTATIRSTMSAMQSEHGIGVFQTNQVQGEGGMAIEIRFQNGSVSDSDIQAITDQIRVAIQGDLPSGIGLNVENLGGVSASATGEHIERTVMAVGVALLAILFYMLFRFKMTSGVAALIGLVHDVLVMLAVTAIFRVQINAAFIAALITVVAYSINNTLILFDRVRHLEKNNTNKESPEIITDRAVKETFVRTMLTMVTTLVPIIVLLIFGVPLIREFAAPILFGLVAGTFSTIFVTTSLYVRFENYKLWRAKDKKVKLTENKQEVK